MRTWWNWYTHRTEAPGRLRHEGSTPFVRTSFFSMNNPENKIFDEEKYTLMLNIDKQSIDLSDLQVIAKQNNFDEREEFHITIIGFRNGKEIGNVLDKLSSEDKQYELLRIKSLIDETDWSFELKSERYHISKEYPRLKELRESYIQIVNLPIINEFYDKLNNILGTNLESPPPHITLYTSGSDREKSKIGIGINSENELSKMNPKPI